MAAEQLRSLLKPGTTIETVNQLVDNLAAGAGADLNYFNEFVNNYIFLKNAIKFYSLLNKKIIVVTHHAPSKLNTCSDKYPKHMYGYGTNMNGVLTSNVICWIFGHTHYSCKFMLNSTLMLSNQFGYINKNEDTNYNLCKSIEI